MTNTQNFQDTIGSNAVDSAGDKIGKIGGVYLDDQTEQPTWVTISTGLFGTKESFAPLYGAQRDGENLRLAVTKAQVKDAPNVEGDGHLEESENDALYEYYGAATGSQVGTTGRDEQRSADTARTDTTRTDTTRTNAGTAPTKSDTAPATEPRGHDVSGPNTDDAMTRSEEQLHVGTQSRETGRARLRKYVVTEDVTQTVPVSHEEVRVEREPITDANRGDATSGKDISEEEHEVTLHGEQAVVSKETVPVERVRLGVDTVTEEQTVNEQVRKEQIDTPDADGTSSR